MIPRDIEEFGTEGEKAFYKFLEGVAKPDAHYLCWYLSDINGNEPDFLLYCEVSLRHPPIWSEISIDFLAQQDHRIPKLLS